MRTMCFVTRSHIDGTSLLAIRPRPWDTSLQAVGRPMCLDNRNPTVGSVCPGSSMLLKSGHDLGHLCCLDPISGRPGLPPIKCVGCSSNNTAANSGL